MCLKYIGINIDVAFAVKEFFVDIFVLLFTLASFKLLYLLKVGCMG